VLRITADDEEFLTAVGAGCGGKRQRRAESVTNARRSEPFSETRFTPLYENGQVVGYILYAPLAGRALYEITNLWFFKTPVDASLVFRETVQALHKVLNSTFRTSSKKYCFRKYSMTWSTHYWKPLRSKGKGEVESVPSSNRVLQVPKQTQDVYPISIALRDVLKISTGSFAERRLADAREIIRTCPRFSESDLAEDEFTPLINNEELIGYLLHQPASDKYRLITKFWFFNKSNPGSSEYAIVERKLQALQTHYGWNFQTYRSALPTHEFLLGNFLPGDLWPLIGKDWYKWKPIHDGNIHGGGAVAGPSTGVAGPHPHPPV
jgi:hypothetical protein